MNVRRLWILALVVLAACSSPNLDINSVNAVVPGYCDNVYVKCACPAMIAEPTDSKPWPCGAFRSGIVCRPYDTCAGDYYCSDIQDGRTIDFEVTTTTMTVYSTNTDGTDCVDTHTITRETK